METWEKVEKNPGDYLHNIRNSFEAMVAGWVIDCKAMPPEAKVLKCPVGGTW